MINHFSILGLDLFSRKELRYSVRSSRWKTLRSNHLKENPRCAACGRSTKVEVHHIEPVHLNPDRELDTSNLITLCDSPCHIVFGHFMDYKSWNPDVIKDCMVYFNKYQNRPYKS